MKTAIVKTSFWDDEDFNSLHIDTKLVYCYLLTCPGHGLSGIIKINRNVMHAQIGFNKDTIELALKQLVESGWIELYTKYVRLTHDHVEAKKGRFTDQAIAKELDDLPLEVKEFFYRYDTGTLPEHNNKYNNNKYNNNIKNTEKVDKDEIEIQEIYNFYIKCFKQNPNRYKLSPNRKIKIKARLKDAGLDMLKQAIEKTSNSSFHLGFNDRKWKADLDFIIRSYEQVEKLSNLSVKAPITTPVKPNPNIPKPVEREIKQTPEQIEKNLLVLRLVRENKAKIGDMIMLKNKSIEELKEMLKSV